MSVTDLSNQYCHFEDDDAFVETERPGFRRRVITGEHLQLCFWRIKGGSTGSFLHHHDANEQLGVIARGKLDFRIGSGTELDERVVLGEGEIYLAPPGIEHGDSVFIGDDELDECWIIDVFSPPRNDLAET
ncbi:MAG: cupin domain-containing protein [Actinomycetota bacterium]